MDAASLSVDREDAIFTQGDQGILMRHFLLQFRDQFIDPVEVMLRDLLAHPVGQFLEVGLEYGRSLIGKKVSEFGVDTVGIPLCWQAWMRSWIYWGLRTPLS